MSNAKEMRKLVKQLKSYNYLDVELTRSNHYKIYRRHDDGTRTLLTTIPRSPSDYHSYRNTLMYLRRAGVPV